eukprot:TRINITY_DN6342_c0_g1_i3.p1 TRINITY_DN6342_c0_g1~~TRINITY_DN6342_c0_g1_i3.p1  ORF type:complete len:502 (-),score=176.42 TRINITY_DN6342_c0_g1_i3:357-1718(-)
MLRSLVGSEMCIRDRVSTQSTGSTVESMVDFVTTAGQQYGALGQDYQPATVDGFDNSWAQRRSDIMERAAVNAQLKDSDKVERRLKCQQEEFLGCLKQHEDDKLTLGKYLKELEEQNAQLLSEKEGLGARLEEVEHRAENYKLALDEFQEERESLLKYWKQDQQKLAKLVGPDYDTMDIDQVRLMDLTTIDSMAQEQNKLLCDGVNDTMSTFQKRMQARTRSLQEQLANEKSVVFRTSHDGTLFKQEPNSGQPAALAPNPDATMSYWSPLDQCYHVLSDEEKHLALEAGATLNTGILNQETEEVRTLQRRVAELESVVSMSGASMEELDALQAAVAAAHTEAERQKQRANTAEQMSAAARIEVQAIKATGGSAAAGTDAQVAMLQNQVSKLSSDVTIKEDEKDRLKRQHEKEKEMFMEIAEKLSKEVDDTKKALSAVFESYPHLKSVVQGGSA